MSKKMLAAAAAAFLIAGPALADSDATTTTHFFVRTAGVDFSDQHQVQALYRRIKIMANDACANPSSAALALYVPTVDKQCVSDAVANAVHALNQPVLTADYEASPQATNRALAGNDQ